MADIEVTRQQEEALIGSVLRDGKAYEQAREIVTPGKFGVHVYGWAWQAFENLHESGLTIDVITVGDELERMGKMQSFSSGSRAGRSLLAFLREHGDPKHFLSYAENVADYAIKRELTPFFLKYAHHAENGRRGKDILKDINSDLSKIQIYTSQDEYTVPISDAVSEAYDWTDAASQGKIVGVPTGFADLDRILGSMINGNVYIVAARPKQGKTALLMGIAKNAAQVYKKRVGIFSLEMSRMQIAQRLISQESKVDLHSIIQGKLLDDEWSAYTQGVAVIADLPIIINDLSSININQIRQTSRKIAAAGGLDLLIVDYIQLADSGGRHERRELEVSAVSRGLKYLARELNVPILAAAQLSRAVEQRAEKKPILSDLRESGSLEQDSYAVMFIYRKDDVQEIAEIVVAAHRNGPVGSCELLFRGPYASFENLYKEGAQS